MAKPKRKKARARKQKTAVEAQSERFFNGWLNQKLTAKHLTEAASWPKVDGCVLLVEVSVPTYTMLKKLVSTGLYGPRVEHAARRIIERFLWEFSEKPVFKL
jgi:hypothetical protein